ncbi:hypothetical protein L6R52_39585, partial [Myxococcota bacterium]|nr:hypothetical protein [Myxococcota bacterium]
PSNAHMANFMTQIFGDEITQEREALAQAAVERRRKTPPPIPAGTSSIVEAESPGAYAGALVGRAKTPAEGNANGRGPALIVVDSQMRPADSVVENDGNSYEDEERPLAISLRSTELERLRVAAERHGVSIEEVVRDLVRSSLKYM